VAVGVAIGGVAEPQPHDHLDAQIVAQALLDLLARERRVAVGVQQALLGGDEGPLAVDEERATLQHERGLVATHAEVPGDQARDLRVAVVWEVLLAPRVEPEVDQGDAARSVPDEDRAVVAHPRVVDREREDIHAVAAAPAGRRPAAREAQTMTTGSKAAIALATVA
jgi:hypothetical protein